MLKALRSKLAVKIIAGIVGSLLIFAVLSSLIGYSAFEVALEERYADTGYRIGRLAAQIVDADNLDAYLDADYRQTDEYKTAMQRLDNVTQRMNAAFIYILQPVDDEWKEVRFLFETVNDNYELSPYLPGHVRESASEEYSIKYGLVYDGKSSEECVFRSARQTTTGAHVSSLVPVKNSDGDVVGVMCVQLQMVELGPARAKFLKEIALAALVMIELVSLAYGWSIRRTVAKPIRRIASETVRFSRDNELPEVSLTDSTKGEDEIKLLAMHVDKMEFAIMNYTENLKTVTSQKDRMEGELNVASGIQQGIIPNTFPPFPERDEFSLYAHMTPAKEVGGDFYDFFFIDDDHLGLVIADVSGKGAPAALFMMATKIMVKNRAQLGGTPAEVLADVNQQLCRHRLVRHPRSVDRRPDDRQRGPRVPRPLPCRRHVRVLQGQAWLRPRRHERHEVPRRGPDPPARRHTLRLHRRRHRGHRQRPPPLRDRAAARDPERLAPRGTG